eukprot:SAG31_NODE_419_length_15872_cov_21.857985_4_plen_84_part_00
MEQGHHVMGTQGTSIYHLSAGSRVPHALMCPQQPGSGARPAARPRGGGAAQIKMAWIGKMGMLIGGNLKKTCFKMYLSTGNAY